MSVVEIEGVIQNYAWGSRTGIAKILGREPSEQPQAELWLGTHERGRARVVGSSEGADLLSVLGQELPFLFKILAADEPLSLQAHPSEEQAQEGFWAEEKSGPPVTAPTRNYRDPHHKPELICALTEFHALSGFREVEEGAKMLRAFGAQEALPEVISCLDRDQLESAFRTLFAADASSLEQANAGIRARAQQPESLEGQAASFAPWALELATSHPRDPGVVAALLLHYVRLTPGEAIFLPAGNLHAYLRGVGIEIMANSDNVLRGGLTPKHVDVEELCRVLRFEAFCPPILRGDVEQPAAGIRISRYPTSAKEFELRRFELQGSGSTRLEGLALLFVLEGDLEVERDGVHLSLGAGQSAVISSSDFADLSGKAHVAVGSPAPS